MVRKIFSRRGTLLAVCCLAACSAPEERPASSRAGFTSLFDGKTLSGWRGEPALWSIRDGALTGEATTKLTASSFLIHDGRYADFELHFRYRITDTGNSGVQFRSAVADEARYDVAGYQANVVPSNQEVRFGMIYDNLGRNEIALLGEKIVISEKDGKTVRDVQGSVNPIATLLGAYRPYPAWNDYVVIAHGNRIVHAINGYLALDAVDDSPAAEADGVFALQIDRFGTPMQVQFKDIAVKRLTHFPDIAGRFISKPGAAETTAEIPKRPGAK